MHLYNCSNDCHLHQCTYVLHADVLDQSFFFLCVCVCVGSKSESCARIMWNICRHEGPRHLMKGLLPRLVAVPSMMSCFYVINEELERKILGTTQLVS